MNAWVLDCATLPRIRQQVLFVLKQTSRLNRAPIGKLSVCESNLDAYYCQNVDEFIRNQDKNTIRGPLNTTISYIPLPMCAFRYNKRLKKVELRIA